MNTTHLALTMALALLTLLRHHGRERARHDRVAEAIVAALRLVDGRRVAPAQKSRTKPAPARLPAPRARRGR